VGIAEVTTGAFFRRYNHGDVLFFIESQHLRWAEIHTKMTALAPQRVGIDLSAGTFPVLFNGGCGPLSLVCGVHFLPYYLIRNWFAQDLPVVVFSRKKLSRSGNLQEFFAWDITD
jgi:hypothetical protein